MILHFSNVPLVSLNNAAFGAFFAAATLTGHAEFNLAGSADVIARTSIGDVSIAAIPFNVPSSLNGINDFGGTASLTDVRIIGSGGKGGNEFTLSTLNSHLNNPSNISLSTNDVSLGVSYQGTYIGRAAIDVCPSLSLLCFITQVYCRNLISNQGTIPYPPNSTISLTMPMIQLRRCV
jgi:Protein of unknown function (DUF3712)